MNTNWGIKSWSVLVIISIVLIGWILVEFQSLPHFDIHNFDLTNVTEIKISDRGLVGNGKKEIEDRETVQKFTGLLKSSTKLSRSEAKLKLNHGLCDVQLVDINKNILASISVVKTLNGGIITSGQHCYRSDSILSLIINNLK
ncbi:MAG: hypothetical protein MUE99_10035 [Chitinophagaceae bacterium]|nr:hypothetical protein [Chitinophagaceae bacterium]